VRFRTKNSTTANEFPGVGDFNSTFETVNCHFSFLLLDFGDQHHLSIKIAKASAGLSDLLPRLFA
jgi:hypothetical protein